jgi:hypothetical protein
MQEKKIFEQKAKFGFKKCNTDPVVKSKVK